MGSLVRYIEIAMFAGAALMGSGGVALAQRAPQTATTQPRPAAALEAVEPSADLTRRVTYRQQTVIPLRTATRVTTLIILPADEQVMDVLCGDRDFWQTSAQGNFVFVKPSKEGARTNAHVLTASGNVYSFLLQEVPGDASDLKVYVELDDEGMLARTRGGATTRWVPASEAEAWKRESEAARREAREAVAEMVVKYPLSLRYDYEYKRSDQPFYVDAIWHDGKNTYIRARTNELPALYELKDGKPSLIQFTAHQQTYVVPKVLDAGYLAIGKKKAEFRRVR